MGEQHLDRLPEPHGRDVGVGLGDGAGDVARVFMLLAGDLAGIGVGAAAGLRWTGLAGLLARPVARGSLPGRAAVRVRAVAAELLDLVTLGADVAVVLRVPLDVGARPGSVGPAGLVPSRQIASQSSAGQWTTGMCGAISRSTSQPSKGPVPYAVSAITRSGWRLETRLHPFEHGLRGPDLRLPDRPSGFDVEDYAVIGVDQVVVRLAEERRALARRRPLAGRVREGRELRLHLRGRAEGVRAFTRTSGVHARTVERLQVFPDGARRCLRVDAGRVPLVLRDRVLLVRVRLDEARVDGHALATHQALGDAARDDRLEQMPQ